MVPISYTHRYRNLLNIDPTTSNYSDDYDMICIRNLISRVIEVAVNDLKHYTKDNCHYRNSYKLFFCNEKEYVKLREI